MLPDSKHTKDGKCRYCGTAIWSEVRHCYRCPNWEFKATLPPDDEPDTKEDSDANR